MSRARPGVLVLALVAAAVIAAAAAPSARADGDPGSDVLVYQDLFAGTDAGLSVQQQLALGGLLKATARTGAPVRVAIIASPFDLGAITGLWRNPRAYARFLGLELSLVYKQRLLMVMPNGFGFNWTGHAAAPGYAVLATVPLTPTPAGMAQAAATAVRKLAAAGGVTVSATAGAKVPASSTNRDRITIVVAVVGALLLGAALRLALRRR